MDGMASVLFVVTIPTAAEEKRLRREFLTKKYEYMKSEQADDTPTSTSKARPPTTTTTTTEVKNKNEGKAINDNAKIFKDIHPPIGKSATSEVNEVLSSIQYEASSKQRNNGQNNTLEEPSDAATVQQLGGSLTSMRKSWGGIKDILSVAKQKNIKKKDQYIDLELSQDIYMETVLKEILKTFQIQGAIWKTNSEGQMYQIFFTVEFNETYEKILYNLNEWGIGDREGSTVSAKNCITSKTFSQKIDNDVESEFNEINNFAQKQSIWERFMNSVRSRLNVATIIRDVRQDAAITFDFVVLIVILASFGLVEDSTIFLASSMLISPLMGPIIAAIFGTVIKDHSLRRLGLKNEVFGTLIAVFIGFLFGIVVCTTDDRYSIGDGLTDEMIARCELHSLIVGVFTAIPSGAAAAIGILGENIGSLVGVAISASLLPPAGLLWALALIYKLFEKDESRYYSVVKNTTHSNNQATELAILGSISMCLTISNIICIYIMGILVLKIKEIAPMITRNNQKCWKNDIKIARDLTRSGFDGDTPIIDELTNLQKDNQKALGLDRNFWRNIDKAIYHNTWSPIGGRHHFGYNYKPTANNYSTVHPIERLYSTVTKPFPMREKRHRHLTCHPTGCLTDLATSFKILSENTPRCFTMPIRVERPTINIVPTDETITCSSLTGTSTNTSATNTPTDIADGRKRRKFIVTPAAKDPLHSVRAPFDC